MSSHRLLLLLLFLSSTLLAVGPARADEAERRAHYHRPAAEAPPPAAPRRIVSLAPVLTETLFLLGAGERVVGVTRYCDRPAAAKALPKVGGFVDPQLERILELKPDLVVAMPSMGQRAVLDRLRAEGVAVWVGFGDRVSEVRDLLAGLGAALGSPERGQALQGALDGGLKKVASTIPKSAKRPRVLLVFQVSPLVVAGRGTFPDEALTLAGGLSAVPADAPGWPTWSLEALLAARPEVVVAAEGSASAARLRGLLRGAGPTAAGVRVVSAADAILMRPGPTLHDDVATLARLLHPAVSEAP
jgi:iron complex transport system substrate-binding protein